MSEYRYTLQEIDALRAEIGKKHPRPRITHFCPVDGGEPGEMRMTPASQAEFDIRNRAIEEELRTALLAGVKPPHAALGSAQPPRTAPLDEVEAVARAIKACLDGFEDPVFHYIIGEARIRWEREHTGEDDDWWETGIDGETESYRIIARAAIGALTRKPMPMADAPRDGTPVLLFGGEDDNARYAGEPIAARMRTPTRAWWDGESWVITLAEGACVAACRENPTGWLPLPAEDDDAETVVAGTER